MDHLINLLGWISFFLALASYLCGATAIVKGPAHPSIISRFFWLALSVTNFLSYVKIGAGSGLFLAMANLLGCVTIFILALRYGYIEMKRSDLITIIGAVVALLCYVLIPSKLIALSAGLMTHFVSGIPTYKKTWSNPYAEDLAFWFLFALASAFSLLAVVLQGKSLLYPLYCLLFDAGMTVLIVLKRYQVTASAQLTYT